ncbi:MAG TPA: helix-turn-helix domain-containing protein [Pseudolabrys sp.]|nr:helix-turn-helix domain-containing protein [Pseudolabrys sp.]
MTLIETFNPPIRRRPVRRRPVLSPERQLCRLLEAVVAEAFAVPPDALRARSRSRADIAFARQAAMYLAHVACGLSYSAIGCGFRRDRTTAAHACRLMEERRDNPAVDCLLHSLEIVCAELARTLRAPAELRP